MHIKPKKSLGQNFLVDKNIQRKIIDSCCFLSDDIVLEIGAGRGELTRLIAPLVKKVYAIEIDKSLLPILEDTLRDQRNIKILNQDILKFDFKKNIKTGKKKIKVVGNIPYYISSPILQHLFKAGNKVKMIYLTVQREFAQRMAAKAGSKDYGALSCFVQYYGEPEIKFIIKNNSFFPAPKVDSAFLEIKIREKALLNRKEKALFFSIVRSAFNQRRKTLRNSLSRVIAKKKLQDYLDSRFLDVNIRPERLTLENLINLTKFAQVNK